MHNNSQPLNLRHCYTISVTRHNNYSSFFGPFNAPKKLSMPICCWEYHEESSGLLDKITQTYAVHLVLNLCIKVLFQSINNIFQLK